MRFVARLQIGFVNREPRCDSGTSPVAHLGSQYHTQFDQPPYLAQPRTALFD